MDENSRVKNIKQRFEDNIANNLKPTTSKVFNDFEVLKPTPTPFENGVVNANDAFSINHRANIKRTPAFRRDKVPNRNADKFNDHKDLKTSIVTNRVNHFNQLKDDNVKCHDSAKSNLNPNGVVDAKSFNTELLNVYEFNDLKDGENEESVAYAKVKKQLKNSKPVTKSRKSAEEHDQLSDSRRSLKCKHGTDGSKKIESSINKENNRRSRNQIWSDKIDEDLSDTLKRVLRSPLPPGPPPKKPPRTFTAKPVNNTVEHHFASSTGSMMSRERLPSIPDSRRPVRSKTESEIMLRKIEMALLKHQKHASPKTLRKVSAPESRLEKYAEINKCRRRLSDKVCSIEPSESKSTSDARLATEANVETCSETGCFPWLSNRTENENADCHIYEDPKQLSAPPSLNEELLSNSLYYMVRLRIDYSKICVKAIFLLQDCMIELDLVHEIGTVLRFKM